MPKKSILKRSEPSLALALIAVAAPLFAAGVAPSFAEDMVDRNDQTIEQSGFLGHELFDPSQFIQQRSKMHRASPEMRSSGSSSSAAHMPRPCDPQIQSSAGSSAAARLRMSDLTESQRETLRKQLRDNACPQDADPAYMDLCERLLQERPARDTRSGLSNPHQ